MPAKDSGYPFREICIYSKPSFVSEAFCCSNILRDAVMCQACMGCFITYIAAFFIVSLA
jgi:hypothetical protein